MTARTRENLAEDAQDLLATSRRVRAGQADTPGQQMAFVEDVQATAESIRDTITDAGARQRAASLVTQATDWINDPDPEALPAMAAAARNVAAEVGRVLAG